MFMNIEKKKQFNLQDFIKLVLANKMSWLEILEFVRVCICI